MPKMIPGVNNPKKRSVTGVKYSAKVCRVCGARKHNGHRVGCSAGAYGSQQGKAGTWVERKKK